ncbi:MAG: GNAT family N-acetyltransferase [Pseudomonadota bacterium]
MNYGELNLAGDQIVLRVPTVDDAEAVFTEYAADPDVTRYMTWQSHDDVATVASFMSDVVARNDSGAEFNWAIAQNGNDRLIGMISARFRGHMADIGYVLGKKYWGRGYMTEAVTMLSSTILARSDIFRVWAVCDVDNIGSARVLEKSGFEREGVLRRYMLHPNISSEPRDCLAYARVK